MKYIIQLVTFGLFILHSEQIVSPTVFFWYALILGMSLIYITRKCKPLAMMYFFWLTYLMIFSAIYVFDLPFYMFIDEVDHQALCNKVLINHTLFLSVVFFFQKKVKHPIYLFEHIVTKRNPVVFWGLAFLMFIFINIAMTGDSIVQSGGYTKGAVQQFGGFLPGEYFLILVPIAFIYSGGEKTKQYIVAGLAILFALKGMLFGGRIIALQTGLMIFILFFDSRRLSYFKMITPSVIAYFFFIWFGKIRGNIANWNKFSFFESTGDIGRDIVNSLGNQYDILYASARLYAFVEMGILTNTDRLLSFVYSHIAIFMPFKYLPELANLAAYKQKLYYSGGGSLLSANYYIYAGYFGIFLIGWVVASIFNKLLYTRSTLFILYGIMVLSTYPRWFGYNFITLFKMSFYIVPIYLIIKHFSDVRNYRVHQG